MVPPNPHPPVPGTSVRRGSRNQTISVTSHAGCPARWFREPGRTLVPGTSVRGIPVCLAAIQITSRAMAIRAMAIGRSHETCPPPVSIVHPALVDFVPSREKLGELFPAPENSTSFSGTGKTRRAFFFGAGNNSPIFLGHGENSSSFSGAGNNSLNWSRRGTNSTRAG